MTDRSRIHEARVRRLNRLDPYPEGHYILYWMQQSQRTRYNHALEHAIDLSHERSLPVLVVFGLMDDYPEANQRHYRFMLDGLPEIARELAGREIGFICERGHPAEVALRYASDAAAVVCDAGYLRHQRQWRRKVAREAGRAVHLVETDLIVPVEEVSNKREYAARTIRKKLMSRLDEFLDDPGCGQPGKPASELKRRAGLDVSSPSRLLDQLKLDRSVPPVHSLFSGGAAEGERLFLEFLQRRFERYAPHRNQPQTDDVSHMSRFLHFGMVSPVWLARNVRREYSGASADAFIEELVVRRELSMNFVYFAEDDYDQYSGLPRWARQTLLEHKADPRDRLYTRDELEEARTHDPYWNAAMREMRFTGYMHNYMRMYWGKKILEWTQDPEEAFRTTLYLNNRYFLDGRDANSFTGVAWVFGNHDRPWAERKVFGKIRYMAASGLERKTRPGEYVAKVERLVVKMGGESRLREGELPGLG